MRKDVIIRFASINIRWVVRSYFGTHEIFGFTRISLGISVRIFFGLNLSRMTRPSLNSRRLSVIHTCYTDLRSRIGESAINEKPCKQNEKLVTQWSELSKLAVVRVEGFHYTVGKNLTCFNSRILWLSHNSLHPRSRWDDCDHVIFYGRMSPQCLIGSRCPTVEYKTRR